MRLLALRRSQCSALLNLCPPARRRTGLSGIAEVFGSPLQTIREIWDCRLDTVFRQREHSGGIYTVDDGNDFTLLRSILFSSDVVTLREQVARLEETHVFSPRW